MHTFLSSKPTGIMMTIVLHLVLMLYKRIVVNWQAIKVTKRSLNVLTNVGKAMVCHRLRRGFS